MRAALPPSGAGRRLVQISLNTTATGWINIEPIVVPEDPFSKLQRLGSPVPLLIGTNSDELAFIYVLGPTLDASGYAASVHTQFDALAAGAGDTILSLYPATDYTNPNYALNAVESDADYTCNTRNFARAVSGAQRPSVGAICSRTPMKTTPLSWRCERFTWRSSHSYPAISVRGVGQSLLSE